MTPDCDHPNYVTKFDLDGRMYRDCPDCHTILILPHDHKLTDRDIKVLLGECRENYWLRARIRELEAELLAVKALIQARYSARKP